MKQELKTTVLQLYRSNNYENINLADSIIKSQYITNDLVYEFRYKMEFYMRNPIDSTFYMRLKMAYFNGRLGYFIARHNQGIKNENKIIRNSNRIL